MEKVKDISMYFLATIVVAGFFTFLYILIYTGVPEQNGELLYLSAGTLLAAFSTVMNYFFGSSAGSKEKTKMLKKD